MTMAQWTKGFATLAAVRAACTEDPTRLDLGGRRIGDAGAALVGAALVQYYSISLVTGFFVLGGIVDRRWVQHLW